MRLRGWAVRWLPRIESGALLVVLSAGCGSSSSPRGSASGRPSTSATLQIVSPAPNARTGADVDVTLRLEGGHVVPPTQVGGALRGDQGHIHLSVDGVLVAMPLRLSYRLSDLSPGAHTLEAEFVASDHLPFSNRVVAAVTFEVT